MIVFQIATHHKLPTPSRKILESTSKLLLLNHTSHCGASTPTILPSTRSICVKQYFAPNSQHTSHVSDGVPLQRDGRSQPCWWDDAGIVSVIPRVQTRANHSFPVAFHKRVMRDTEVCKYDMMQRRAGSV